MSHPPRIAARALIRRDDRLLLVNAFPPGAGSDLWVAPGGGVERDASLHDTLIRETFEETGLHIAPGPLAAVSEFRNRATGFHQVELLFHATVTGGDLHIGADPDGVVHAHLWAAEADAPRLRFKPDHLLRAAFHPSPALYHGAEEMLVP